MQTIKIMFDAVQFYSRLELEETRQRLDVRSSTTIGVPKAKRESGALAQSLVSLTYQLNLLYAKDGLWTDVRGVELAGLGPAEIAQRQAFPG